MHGDPQDKQKYSTSYHRWAGRKKLLRGPTFIPTALFVVLPASWLHPLPVHRRSGSSDCPFPEMSADSGAPLVERARTIAGQTLVGGRSDAGYGALYCESRDRMFASSLT
jgi:hypothetical protein